MLFARNPRLLAVRCSIAVQLYRNSMKLTFASASRMFYFNTEVHQIDVPTFSGSFGILAYHVPTLAVIKPGIVSVVEKDGKRSSYFASSGLVCVNEDATVQVLVEEAYRPKYFDFAECRELVSHYKQEYSKAIDDYNRAIATVSMECAEELVFLGQSGFQE